MMFKNKIAIKLTAYFAAALLTFSVIIGTVFMVLFRNYTIEVHKDDMEKRAATIASTLSEFITVQNGTKKQGASGGYGAYMRSLPEIAMADVWVVDENFRLMMRGFGQQQRIMNCRQLPENAFSVIEEVFTGKTATSYEFSEVLSAPTLTVGEPIKDKDGAVKGVVLLHSPVSGTDKALSQGFTVLIVSILAALVISFMLSVVFSLTFTKPLNKMKNTAIQLAEGDYTAKNNIHQNDEIGKLSDTMDALSDRLYDASMQTAKLEQMRRDFVANISHELRTPVTVIRGSLEALVDEIVTDPEQVKYYHSQMLSEALFLQRLVGDLLDLARLQNADFVIEKEKVSISSLIDDVSRSIMHIADKKGVIIKVQKDDFNCELEGDYGRLRQMLMILLDNAVKFSPEGSEISITLENRVISVRDHGIGIPKEDLPYIFDRFYKCRSEQNKTGTGLGLAIAKQIAQRHDIDVSVESNAGEGTVFRMKM